MRALSAAPGMRLRWTVSSPPPPGPDGAIVHPIACSTCDLDCAIALGATQFSLPLHLGHECVAEVLSVGERVSSIRPGDRVIVPFQISCSATSRPVTPTRRQLRDVPPGSMFGMGLLAGHWGGAFSDEIAVPFAEAMLVALPAGIDPALATGLADNICDAYRHVAPHLPALLAADPDAQILILGAQRRSSPFGASVSLYAGLLARALGARNVHLADARAHVRAQAERVGLGALTPRELNRYGTRTVVVDASVNHLRVALAHTAPDGIYDASGSLHRSGRIPLLKMYARNVTLHVGRTHARAHIPQLLELIQAGRFNPSPILTCEGPLDDAPALLAEHFSSGGIKAVLTA